MCVCKCHILAHHWCSTECACLSLYFSEIHSCPQWSSVAENQASAPIPYPTALHNKEIAVFKLLEHQSFVPICLFQHVLLCFIKCSCCTAVTAVEDRSVSAT
uniref:PPUP7457 n=1 Tax=Poeciliopsis prolifica TaxID=188132 RepID=A0A0S7ENR1_9TELE